MPHGELGALLKDVCDGAGEKCFFKMTGLGCREAGGGPRLWVGMWYNVISKR